jgi:EPS-associated MarR family transcriptional regulator
LLLSRTTDVILGAWPRPRTSSERIPISSLSNHFSHQQRLPDTRKAPTIHVHRLNTPFIVEDDTPYKILKTLEISPGISQRELAVRLGVSLGKTNYCLRALIAKGWVKMANFRQNPNKSAYAYLLTPKGIEEKARITVHFLKLKMAEFDALRTEIERLQTEADAIDQSTVRSQVQLPVFKKS